MIINYEGRGSFDQFHTYRMDILLWDFNAKVSIDDIFNIIIGNESFHRISNGNAIRVANSATSKNLIVKSTMFPHHSIHKFCLDIFWWKDTLRLITFWKNGDGILVYFQGGRPLSGGWKI
jgi:hypothetical protein